MGIQIGSLVTRNKVFLAPMSGVSDMPFRSLAAEMGAGLVVSEMVASEQLVRNRRDMVRRAASAATIRPFAIQLAGREPVWMAEGARIACDMGADLIDINMGCPAREVAGKLSGSALMREPDHALRLIAATVSAASCPVSVKMRLGWDHDSVNAPELAASAESAGVSMITVHGRTRCQFYKGRADWNAINAVKKRVGVPVIANGDAITFADVREMLRQSGADGVMIGRASYGRPWLAGVLAELLSPGSGRTVPNPLEQTLIALRHYREMIEFYGYSAGLKIARKHVGWYLRNWADQKLLPQARAAALRKTLMACNNSDEVMNGLRNVPDEMTSVNEFAECPC